MNQEYLDFAFSVAHSAGRLVLQHYRDSLVSMKSDGTEVTEADEQAEHLMRTMIERRFPSHDILGEELGYSGSAGGRHVWVLDPIDGTSWYAMGAPLFGNLVALLENGEPIVGVIHLPALGETVCAAKGYGCWFSDGMSAPERIQVSPDVPIGGATVTASGIHGSDFLNANGSPLCHLRDVMQSVAKFKFYGDCAQHVLVCRGHTHAAIDAFMHPWDSAAIIPCIEEAGGLVSTLDGRRENVVFGGSLLTSCSRSLHEQILQRISAEGTFSSHTVGITV
jgi:histidinol-phosphatase